MDPVFVDSQDGELTMVPLFTEEVHAERFRDSLEDGARIDAIDSHELLALYLNTLRENFKVTHVAIDPFPEPGKQTFFASIDDIIGAN